MRKMVKHSALPIAAALTVALGAGPANAQMAEGLPGDCSPSTGCVTDGHDRWQAPTPPPLTPEESALYKKCEAQVVAAGLTGLGEGLAWLGAVAQFGAAGIDPCKEVHDKYQQRVG